MGGFWAGRSAFDHSSAPDDIESYKWNVECLKPLFTVTLMVLEGHGLGETWWATVCWEMCDKVCCYCRRCLCCCALRSINGMRRRSELQACSGRCIPRQEVCFELSTCTITAGCVFQLFRVRVVNLLDGAFNRMT